MLNASSSPGDVVPDPVCGCATAPCACLPAAMTDSSARRRRRTQGRRGGWTCSGPPALAAPRTRH
ncbi:MAG: hypothetical protein ACK4GO_05600 [Gemmobacter sp.]